MKYFIFIISYLKKWNFIILNYEIPPKHLYNAKYLNIIIKNDTKQAFGHWRNLERKYTDSRISAIHNRKRTAQTTYVIGSCKS